MGIIFGEIIGNSIYEADIIRHEQWRLKFGHAHQSMPHHYGWLICIITYIVSIIIGMSIERYMNSKKECK